MKRVIIAVIGAHLAIAAPGSAAEREYAYDRDSHIGGLDEALDQAVMRDWIIISMTDDWATVLSPETERAGEP